MNEEELGRIGSMLNVSRSRAIQGLDGDSKAAAEAVQLEKSTGADAGMIYANREPFARDYKSFLTERMLDRNPGLSDYIDSHPMAAIVSKDDWNRMADFYDHLDYYIDSGSSFNAVNLFKGGIGAAYGAGQALYETVKTMKPQFVESEIKKHPEMKEWHPYVMEAIKGAVGPFETAIQLMSAIPHAFAGAGYGGAVAAGATESTARKLGREFGGLGEYFTNELVGTGLHPPYGRPVQIARLARELEVSVPEAAKAIRLAEPYIRAGEMPPPGTHPVWDGVIRENVENGMSVYDALVDATNKTETKALSPDLLADAIAKKTKEDIHIHWDAVRNLYGDKVPEPGDGLLGDIPGVVEQFQNAMETSTDVRVPLSEWLTKVPDEVVKALHDDIRLRATDPTLNEVKDFPKVEQAVKDLDKPTPPMEPEAPVEEPGVRMTRLRQEYAQALTERSPSDPMVKALRAISGYDWKPEAISEAVTWAHLNGRPDIVERAIEMSRLTDPAVAVRLEAELFNLKRHQAAQGAVKAEQGAREMFSLDDWTTHDTTTPEVLEPPKSIAEMMATGEWVRQGQTTITKITPEGLAARQALKATLDPLLQKFVGKGKPLLSIVEDIRMGEPPTGGVRAGYLSYGTRDPVMLIALNVLDPDYPKSIQHEIIHHFRTYDYFTRQEWSTLRDMVVREKLIQKHGLIRKGYDPKDVGRLIEEAIAHEFPEWMANKATYPDTVVGRIFQKIADFFENARIALKELFGGRLSESEIFQSIASGRIGQRGPGEPLFGAKDIREAAQKFEPPKVEEPGAVFAPGALLPRDRYAKYMKLIDKQNAKDVQKLYDEAAKEVKKRLTPEWKKNHAEQYKQSVEDIKNRPDFRVAAFFRKGIIGDQKLDSLPKLDPAHLTEEQKAALPQNWLRARDGFAPDDLAGFFGYRTGDELVGDLVRFEEAKGRMKPETFLDLQASAEAERRMQAKYGNLDENILREAREHAIGLERFDLMHEEYLALGQGLEQQMPLSKKDLRDQAWHQFNAMTSSQVALIKFTRDLGKSNKAAEAAWLKGDALGAFVERERSLRLQALSELAKKFEKEKATYARLTKRYSKREVDNHPPEFTNWIHHILNRVGEEVRDPTDLQTAINAFEHKTLKEFVEGRNRDGLPDGIEEFDTEYFPNMPIWEALTDTDWAKHIDATTVGEFRAINTSIKALDKIGRDELMTVLRGQAVERDALLNRMVQSFEAVGKEGLPDVGDQTTTEKLKSTGLRLHVGLLQMEYIWGRLDKTPYGGIFWDAFTKPFSEAGNEYRLLVRDFSRQLTKLGKETIPNRSYLWKKVPNEVLMEPLYGKPEEGAPILKDKLLGGGYIRRNAFRAVMLNIGNESNIDKLARGYHTTPEAIRTWVDKHATKEDWAYVRGVWRMWDELQGKSDLVSQNLHGFMMERLPIGQIPTAMHGNIDGGYYPMIYDQRRGGGGKGGKIDPNLPPNINVLTDRGFEMKRTGYAGPVALRLGDIDYQMTRRIRDIAFREVLIESQKFFRNDKFTRAMTKHLGPQYTELLVPYLRDIAGVRGPTSGALSAYEHTVNVVMNNTVGMLVGWNPGTVLKHTGTAFIQSLKELKHKSNMYFAMQDMLLGSIGVRESSRKFMHEGAKIGNLDWKGSGEIQGRRPGWYETFGGASDIVTGRSTLQHKLAHIYSTPIALSDQIASEMLWMAKYREMMQEFGPNMAIEKAHTEAVAIADQAVRRSHGSTAVTSRPSFMRNPWLRPVTALYGFFNHIFNRMYEISWEGRDLAKDIKKGEATVKDVNHLAQQVFFAIVVPAVIEELVTPLFDDEERSLFTRFAMGLGYPIGSSMPIIREAVHAMYTKHDPGFGILTASAKSVTNLVRQLQKEQTPENFGDTLLAVNSFLGVATGLTTQQIGRWQKFAWNYYVTQSEQPQGWDEWYRALRYGTSKERRH